jgi:CheY-like chemotaxis protein
MERLHILIVSGEPQILAELKAELMQHFDVSISASSQAAVTALDLHSIAAVIICSGRNSDVALSVYSGIADRLKTQEIPVIILAVEESGADAAVSRYGDIGALVERIKHKTNAEESAPEVKNVDVKASLRGKTILVADDVQLNRDIVGYMLEDVEDLNIIFACDGKEAVELYEKSPEVFSLILMDVQMPLMDGMEATKIIRSMNSGYARDVPIVALTGSDDVELIKKCLKAGMNNFISKPMSYDDLIKIITKNANAN